MGTKYDVLRTLDNAASILESLEHGESVPPAMIANMAYEAREAVRQAGGVEGGKLLRAAPLMLKALKMIHGCYLMAQRSTPANLRRAIEMGGWSVILLAEGAALSEWDRDNLEDLGEEAATVWVRGNP